jgi:radical SAM superfamily enzyme YgiQ (UPF0313 family)
MPRLTTIDEQAYVFPVGIAYISSSLKASGRNVYTLNLTYKKEPVRELLKRAIADNGIDVVETGGLTWQYKQIKEIIDIAREIKPDIYTVVGGNIITGDPEPAMEALENADFGVIGEGEITNCELAEVIESHQNYESVDGIIYKNGNAWRITKPRRQIMDIDRLPFPDYDGFEFAESICKLPSDLYGFLGERTAFVVFSRNCPYNCTFCFHCGKYAQRSLDSVFQEIDMLLSKYNIKNLVIADELFAAKKDYIEEFCKRIKPYGIRFVVQLRVDMVTRELLEMLKAHGCESAMVGLESADNRILKSMRKQITVEQIEKALALLEEAGLSTHGGFIFGDLEETYETAMNTIRWWRDHPQYPIDLHWIIVFPGTYLYKVACERGIIKDKARFIKEGCPYINVSKLSDAEYKEIAMLIETTTLLAANRFANVKLVKKGFGKVDFIGECPFCRTQNVFANLDVFRKMNNPRCSGCGKSVNLVVSDYIDDTFDSNIRQLTGSGKVAVWPVINAVSNMIAAAASLTNENVYFIDSSPFKQGSSFHGKTVYPPDIIEEQMIDVVILSLTTSVSGAIIDTIRTKYHGVRHVVYSGELIFDDFCLEARP